MFPHSSRRLRPNWPLLLITLAAFALRVWRLDAVPPGWRDDELINVFVISQKVLNGQWALFYPDASGHEFLYHALNALLFALFGANALGFRLLSALFGTLAVPLTYQLGRRLFSHRLGLIAAAALAASFWSLVYSRIGLRHISVTVWALLAFIFFWQGLQMPAQIPAPGSWPRRWLSRYGAFTGAAFFAGLGFYTYFAGRGLPLILLAFCGYLALWQHPLLRAHWRGLALAFGLMLLLALPLAVTLRQQPEAQGRVAELAAPLAAARAGDFAPLWRQTATTLRMFDADGDPEWLYNIPHRPVFGPGGAALLWLGVGLALWQGGRLSFAAKGARAGALPYVFLLGWWIAGISPAFISIPPASFGHTIIAQPATFLVAALPLDWLARRRGRGAGVLAALLGIAFVLSVGTRDLPAYFEDWASRGNTRFLYHANMRDVADYAATHPDLTDFGVTDLLAGPWSRLALQMDLANAARTDARPRLYDPRRAIFLALGDDPAVNFHGYPEVPDAFVPLYGPPLAQVGGFTLARVMSSPLPASAPLACFENGLCALATNYDTAAGVLEITWRVARTLDLPPLPLISNPPPPGVYAGPRLWVFAQLVDGAGHFLSGDDGFWVDPQTLEVGDVFRQRHVLRPPEGTTAAAVLFGLYDPLTGVRVRGNAGTDHIQLPLP
ncbi:MAG: glycosyltransferase family 39 protein [Anaerolineales bacterium]|nr:glycosyltransferase family 39 protein [Anaerolineales bacterium]MCB8950881.1 glycosyltransferase family 39 protein [Ardenticatenales bacterium]